MLDTVRVVPRHGTVTHRVRVAGAGLVVALLALLLPWSSSTAFADGPGLLDPVSIPGDFVGDPVNTGGWSGIGQGLQAMCESGGAATAGCIAVAGVGAYEGTCYVLGVIFRSAGSCDGGPGETFHILFGSGGDNRAVYTGPAGTIGVSDYAGPAAPFTARVFAQQWGGNYKWVFTYSTATASGTCVASLIPSLSMSSKTFSIRMPQPGVSSSTIAAAINAGFGVGSGASVSGANCSAAGSFVESIAFIDQTSGQPQTTIARWVADTGAGTPWTVDYQETCRNGTTTATAHQSSTFTPVGGQASPSVSLPACGDVLPGSHLDALDVLGGRAGITAPNPDVKVHAPTTSDTATSTYPLCTTNAPAGGCFLDLQRDGKSCFSGAYCAGWLQNETRWNMSCEWGPYDLALSVCEHDYGTRFDTQAQPSSDPSPTAGAPLPTSGPNPSTPPDPQTPPDPSDSSSQNCYGAAWSWNPIDWVVVPVKCALSWAFVPKTPLQGRIDDIKGKASGKFPFSLLAPLAGFAALIPAGDCPNWDVQVQYPGVGDGPNSTGHTLDKNVVCDSSYTSAVRTARPVFAAMMMVTALWPMIRGIAYGSFPIIKPVPTR